MEISQGAQVMKTQDAMGWGNLTGRNTLDTTTTRKTSDSWLGDTLDVVSQNLTMTLSATLSETLSALSACREIELVH